MAKGVRAYPVILCEEKEGYYVKIPDFDSGTQGDDLADAICMARDAIGILGVDLQDEGKELPEPGAVEYQIDREDIVTYVDVDFDEYRKEISKKAIKKNCTIPYWLNVQAEREGINFSKVLQEALIQKLNIG